MLAASVRYLVKWYGCQPRVHMQVSFVNSICTLKGGTHVKLIIDQICKCAPPLLPAPTHAPLTAD